MMNRVNLVFLFSYKHQSTYIDHIKHGKKKLKHVCLKHKNQLNAL